jgi:hypothetical protein
MHIQKLPYTKNFCTAKETITRQKRQPIEWQKIFASYTSDKGYAVKYYSVKKKNEICCSQVNGWNWRPSY